MQKDARTKAEQLKELEREHAQLNRLAADLELESLAPREISTGNW